MPAYDACSVAIVLALVGEKKVASSAARRPCDRSRAYAARVRRFARRPRARPSAIAHARRARSPPRFAGTIGSVSRGANARAQHPRIARERACRYAARAPRRGRRARRACRPSSSGALASRGSSRVACAYSAAAASSCACSREGPPSDISAQRAAFGSSASARDSATSARAIIARLAPQLRRGSPTRARSPGRRRRRARTRRARRRVGRRTRSALPKLFHARAIARVRARRMRRTPRRACAGSPGIGAQDAELVASARVAGRRARARRRDPRSQRARFAAAPRAHAARALQRADALGDRGVASTAARRRRHARPLHRRRASRASIAASASRSSTPSTAVGARQRLGRLALQRVEVRRLEIARVRRHVGQRRSARPAAICAAHRRARTADRRRGARRCRHSRGRSARSYRSRRDCVRIEYDVRSPCRLPTSVTTGTPMSSASSVPFTPP